ncbi:MAG: metal ABC transporter substrate-binding protein [Actinomycetota bacterium]
MTKNFNASSLRRRGIASLAVLTLASLGLSCSGEDQSQPVDEPTADTTAPETTDAPVVDLPDVVVTYSVLGALVEQLLGDHADVTVLIPDGQDPHDFEPSPRDIERINEAVLVVANGLDLEEGLDDALTTAEESGISVFFVTDHVQVLDVVDVNDHSAHGHNHAGAQTEHSHGDDDHTHEHSKDPHVWLSPATMLEALPALVDAAQVALGVDLASDGTALAAELAAIDTELATLFDGLDDCQLVTGHNELGYFAQRYGCTVIAAILSSPSTTAEESAGNVEFVIDVIKTHGADAVFTSLGTNAAVAKQVADAAGVKLVEISTHYLGNETSYGNFIRTLGNTIATSLR